MQPSVHAGKCRLLVNRVSIGCASLNGIIALDPVVQEGGHRGQSHPRLRPPHQLTLPAGASVIG